MAEFRIKSEDGDYVVTHVDEGRKKRVKLERLKGANSETIFDDVFASFTFQLQQNQDQFTFTLNASNGSKLPQAVSNFKLSRDVAKELRNQFKVEKTTITHRSWSWMA